MEKKKTPFFALTRIRALAVAPNGLFLQRTRARDFLVIKAGTLQGAYHYCVKHPPERPGSKSQAA